MITKGTDATGWRLPAPQLEALVLTAVRAHLTDRAARHDLLAAPEAATAEVVAAALQTAVTQGAAADLWSLVEAVQIRAGAFTIRLSESQLATRLALAPEHFNPASITFECPFTARRRGVETRLATGTLEPAPDPVLQRNLARAHRWATALRKGESLTSIACAEQKSESYIRTRVNLAFLAPRIQRAILDGTLPTHLTTDGIMRLNLPSDWSAQIRALGL